MTAATRGMAWGTTRHAASLLLPLLLSFASVPASAVNISPIMVELSPQKRVASIRVLNDSTEAMTFQAETLSWQQTAGEDRYAPTQELLVAPTIAQIAPGASQIFRVTLRKPPSVEMERAYRLVLEDVTAETTKQPGVVKFRFSHNIPLFATPGQLAVVNPQWHRCAAPADKACVELENRGNRRVRMSSLTIEGLGWRRDIEGGTTVLAGASRQWMFDLKAGQPGAIRVIATTGVGDILKAVELPGPAP